MGARWQACEQRRVGASTCSKNRRRGGRRARAACRRGQSRAAADPEGEGDHAAGGPGLGPSAPAPIVSSSLDRHHGRDGGREDGRPLFTPASGSCGWPVCSCSRRFKSCSVDTRRLVAPLVASEQLDVQPAASRESSKLPIARQPPGTPLGACFCGPAAAGPFPASLWPARTRAVAR